MSKTIEIEYGPGQVFKAEFAPPFSMPVLNRIRQELEEFKREYRIVRTALEFVSPEYEDARIAILAFAADYASGLDMRCISVDVWCQRFVQPYVTYVLRMEHSSNLVMSYTFTKEQVRNYDMTQEIIFNILTSFRRQLSGKFSTTGTTDGTSPAAGAIQP